jgi:ABC-type methionine transport system ATPase subunit
VLHTRTAQRRHEKNAPRLFDPMIAAGIDQLILELKRAFRITIIVVTHELASSVYKTVVVDSEPWNLGTTWEQTLTNTVQNRDT